MERQRERNRKTERDRKNDKISFKRNVTETNIHETSRIHPL